MKKIATFVLATWMVLSFAACGSEADVSEEKQTQGQITTQMQEQPQFDILGEWVSVEDDAKMLLFRKGGTCVSMRGAVFATFKEAEDATYSYRVEGERFVMIEGENQTTYEMFLDNGTVVLGVEGEVSFVRVEDYEFYHEAYLAERAKEAEQFYREGKEGRVTLVFGATYSISDELDMTVHECVRGEVADRNGEYPLLLRVTLANVTDELVVVRYGRYEGKILETSDLTFYSKTESQSTGNIQFVTTFMAGISDIVLTGPDDDYTGSGPFRDAEVLEANAQKEYYMKIPGATTYLYTWNGDVETFYKPDEYYSVFSFDKMELFCPTKELEGLVER